MKTKRRTFTDTQRLTYVLDYVNSRQFMTIPWFKRRDIDRWMRYDATIATKLRKAKTILTGTRHLAAADETRKRGG